MVVAITREVGFSIGRCELTHLARAPIDAERARAQHGDYENGLRELGCEVRSLPPEPALPDSVFVEDAAVVLDELAVIARPGAATRRDETDSVAAALAPLRPLVRIEPPATLEGGDVMRIGRTLFVGRSSRTNRAGVEQLQARVGPAGYVVRPVTVHGCLHLKSAVTPVGPGTLLLNPDWIDTAELRELECIEIDPAEPFGANALWIGDAVLYPREHPETARRLRERGIRVRTVEVSELAKAEGGVTCCSLIVGPA